MKLKVYSRVLYVIILLTSSSSVWAQKRITMFWDYSLQSPLYNGNAEYLRKLKGKNYNLGFSAQFSLPKSYVQAGWFTTREAFRDVVRDEWRAFEFFDTVQFTLKRNSWKIILGNLLMDKKVKIHVENGFVLGKWGTAYSEAFGQKGKRVLDTFTGSEKQFRTGVRLRSGINISYHYRRFVIATNVFSEVLLRTYWKNTYYADVLEPYPRCLVGVSFKLGYNLFNLK